MEYQNKIIIYIDLLGFSDYIYLTSNSQYKREERIDKIQKLLEQLRKILYTDDTHLHLSSEKQITHFSDLIVISLSPDDIENVMHELYEVQILISNSILNGFLMRGCIIYGDLIHTDKVIFGPGLIKAYEIEKDCSIYPRVLVDKAIVKDINIYYQEKYNTYDSRDLNSIISIDNDGEYFIDYFLPIHEKADNFFQFINYIEAFTKLLIEIIDDKKLLTKVGWLLPKYNTIVKQLFDLIEFNSYGYASSKEDLTLNLSLISEIKKDSYKDKI